MNLIDYDDDKTFYHIKRLKNIKDFNKFLNDNFYYGYNDFENGKRIITNDIDFNKYKLSEINEFASYRTGCCWDFADFEAFVFEKYFKYQNKLRGMLRNNSYSLYYIQFETEDGNNPTHTWLAYMQDDKVYIFESSWSSEQGITEFNTEKEMVDYYWKKHKQLCNKSSVAGKGAVFKYCPIFKSSLATVHMDCSEFMEYIYSHGCVIKSEFKEFVVSRIYKDWIE